MAVYRVQPNGQAPPGLSVGDFVDTNGGMYQIAAPGSYGAVYNPASGYWSYNTNSEDYRIQSLINSAQSQAQQNTMTSQDFAREQMSFQNTSAQKAMQFSAEQAALNREWQERLSNTAHQREVKDLIAAGLNPILSAHSSGATTPSGASAAGVASPGAQGSVDTGGTNAATQLLATLLNNETSLDITKLQTAATMYAADRGLAGSQAAAGATMAAAGATSAAARYSADQSYAAQMANIANQKWLAENYPSTLTQGVANIANGIGNILGAGNNANASSQILNKVKDAGASVINWFSSSHKNPDYNPSLSMSGKTGKF